MQIEGWKKLAETVDNVVGVAVLFFLLSPRVTRNRNNLL